MTNENTTLYHGTVRLGTFLKNRQILCLKALEGVTKEQAQSEYDVVSHGLATRVREYEKSRKVSYGAKTDEDYSYVAFAKVNPLALIGFKDRLTDEEFNHALEQPGVQSLLTDLKLFGYLMRHCHVYLGDRNVATEHTVPLYTNPQGENIGAMFELELPETMIKRNLEHYPMVWWSIPITPDYVKTIYYRDAEKVVSLLAENQLSNIKIRPLNGNSS